MEAIWKRRAILIAELADGAEPPIGQPLAGTGHQFSSLATFRAEFENALAAGLHERWPSHAPWPPYATCVPRHCQFILHHAGLLFYLIHFAGAHQLLPVRHYRHLAHDFHLQDPELIQQNFREARRAPIYAQE